MVHQSMQIIRDEHAALVAMLRSLEIMVDRGPDSELEIFLMLCG